MEFKCKYHISSFVQEDMIKPDEELYCVECGKWCLNQKHLREHGNSRSSSSSNNDGQQPKKFILYKKAFANRLETFCYTNKKGRNFIAARVF